MNYNVCETDRFDRAIFYKVHCMCGDDDHTVVLELDYDEDLNEITLSFYNKMYYIAPSENWLSRFWEKLKVSLLVLFKGYISLEGYLLIHGERHLNDFIKALEEGKTYLKSRRTK